MSMDFRIWVTVIDLPFERADAWEPVIEALEHRHADLGPIIDWHRGSARFVMSAEAREFGEAADVAHGAVKDALRAAPSTEGLSPQVSVIETESVDVRELALA